MDSLAPSYSAAPSPPQKQGQETEAEEGMGEARDPSHHLSKKRNLMAAAHHLESPTVREVQLSSLLIKSYCMIQSQSMC